MLPSLSEVDTDLLVPGKRTELSVGEVCSQSHFLSRNMKTEYGFISKGHNF